MRVRCSSIKLNKENTRKKEGEIRRIQEKKRDKKKE